MLATRCINHFGASPRKAKLNKKNQIPANEKIVMLNQKETGERSL